MQAVGLVVVVGGGLECVLVVRGGGAECVVVVVAGLECVVVVVGAGVECVVVVTVAGRRLAAGWWALCGRARCLGAGAVVVVVEVAAVLAGGMCVAAGLVVEPQPAARSAGTATMPRTTKGIVTRGILTSLP